MGLGLRLLYTAVLQQIGRTQMKRKNSVGLSFPTEQALKNHMNGISNIEPKKKRKRYSTYNDQVKMFGY